MANNPLVAQGSLNRLRASLTFNSHPELNVTAPYLGKAGISLTLDGPLTQQLEQMTGAVQSPEPFVPVTVSIELIRTQSLAAAFKSQIEVNTVIGDLTVRCDAAALGNYPLINSAIDSVSPLQFNGTTAGYVIVLKAYYNINSSLYDS